jgi:uncharacterized damage-inducible protein DinB
MIEQLITGSQALHEAVANLTEDEAARKPDPSRWSVRDCIEHLALSERGLLRRLTQATPAEPSAPRQQQLAAALANPLAAPEHVQPTGRFETLAQSLEKFDKARAETIRYVEQHQTELPGRRAQHPLIGEVTGEELVWIMSMHVRRHTAQIHQILARTGA